VFSGSQFVVGWNDAGLGTGRFTSNVYLKQLYLSAKPVTGVEVQYGGLYFNRGESTEITSYDNDGYLTGQRVSLKRPKELFFDEISATYGYLGDLTKANINKRWHRLSQGNYHQLLVGKKVRERVSLSLDYTSQWGASTLREAIRVNTPKAPVDYVRAEFYQRVDVNRDAGFALHTEKGLLKKRFLIGGGFAQIDRSYGGLNGDRFNRGKRFLINTTYVMSPEFSLSTFLTRSVRTDYVVANRTRFEIILSYNLLKGFQRAGLF
jgi:hypothetical protein